MNITKQNEDGHVTLSLQGRLDTLTAPELADYIKANLDDCVDLTLNLADVDYVSSAGLRVVLMLQKRFPQAGAFQIVQVSPEVMEVFEMTGFADILSITAK